MSRGNDDRTRTQGWEQQLKREARVFAYAYATIMTIAFLFMLLIWSFVTKP